MTTASQVTQLYKTVVEDVINNVKEAFLDEGVDEQVLHELKQLWDNKLSASKALEPVQTEPEEHTNTAQYPLLIQQPSAQSLQHPYISRTVLTTTAQQPQTYPLAITTHQASELSNAAAAATMALPVGLFQQQLAALSAGHAQNVTLQPTGNGQYIAVQNLAGGAALAQGLTATITIPHQTFVQSQGHIQRQQPAGVTQVVTSQVRNQQGIIQLEGAGDTSSSEDEDFDNDENDDENDDEQNEEDAEEGEEEDPLNSEDDVSEDDDPTELFDSENVVVCQYDKINRNKNKWKFHLKDGIMNLNGRDFVFQRATGDAEW